MGSFLAALLGMFKFFDQVTAFVKMLEKTPMQKRAEAIRRVNDAFLAVNKPDATGKPSGDTSEIEGILN